MARVSKNNLHFNNNNIVIVCEGTETENSYFEELAKESYSIEIRVVPQKSEIVDKKAKQRRRNAIERILLEGDNNIYSGREYYVGLPEVDAKTYDEYHHEPVKWVRAAQLFMERFGFAEGWAVYDLDNKSGRTTERHNQAYELASTVENLHIAFSAYSIEEWFLLHFERNSQPFTESECTHKNGKDDKKIGCGNDNCTHRDNCQGKLCLGGYLRANGLIKDYDKANGADYVEITKTYLHRACVNAAWSRSLKHAIPPYLCNPYTDVDRLVLRILGNRQYENIRWIHVNEEFNAGSSKLEIHIEESVLLICKSKTGFRVTPEMIYWCDDNYDSICQATNLNTFGILTCQSPIKITNKPSGVSVLCIRDGIHEFYVEITETPYTKDCLHRRF